MAILWMDGFNWIAAGTTPASSPTLNALLEEVYHVDTNVVDADADLLSSPGPGNTLKFGNSTAEQIRIDLGTGYTTLFVSFKMRIYESDSSNSFIQFVSTTGNDQGSIVHSPNWGGFKVQRLGATAVHSFHIPDFTPGDEYHFEIKFVNANAPTGEIVVRVNGVTLSNNTGIDTFNFGTGVDRVRIRGQSSGTGEFTEIRDLIINDDSGTIANSWIGPDVHVYGLLPNADGNYSAWTRSSGAVDYTLIDEVSRVSSDYIESATTTQKTSVNLAATGSEANILGVQVHSNALLSAAGSETYREFMRHSTTDGNGTTHTVTSTSEAAFRHVFELNPSTSAQWTAAELDAAEVGVEYI